MIGYSHMNPLLKGVHTCSTILLHVFFFLFLFCHLNFLAAVKISDMIDLGFRKSFSFDISKYL